MLPFYSSLPKGRIQDLAFDRDFYVPKARAPKRWMPSWFPSAVIVRALDILCLVDVAAQIEKSSPKSNSAERVPVLWFRDGMAGRTTHGTQTGAGHSEALKSRTRDWSPVVQGCRHDGKMEVQALSTSAFTGLIDGIPVVLLRPAEHTQSPLFVGDRIYGAHTPSLLARCSRSAQRHLHFTFVVPPLGLLSHRLQCHDKLARHVYAHSRDSPELDSETRSSVLCISGRWKLRRARGLPVLLASFARVPCSCGAVTQRHPLARMAGSRCYLQQPTLPMCYFC